MKRPDLPYRRRKGLCVGHIRPSEFGFLGITSDLPPSTDQDCLWSTRVGEVRYLQGIGLTDSGRYPPLSYTLTRMYSRMRRRVAGPGCGNNLRFLRMHRLGGHYISPLPMLVCERSKLLILRQ